MAVADPVSSTRNRAPRKTSHAADCKPFDVDLLCAKLEAAKIEQDVERARRKHRDALRNRTQQSQPAEPHRRSMTWNEGEAVQDVELSKPSPSSTREKGVRSKPLFAAVSVERTQSEMTRDPTIFGLGNERPPHPNRYSTIGLPASRFKTTDVPKRKPVPTTTKQAHFSEPEELETEHAQKPSPIDPSKRRSKTFPFQMNKLTRPRPVSAYSYSETMKARPQRDHSPESPMGLVNEYTMSFDLADMLQDERIRRPSQSRGEKRRDSSASPPLVPGIRSRSLLNLSSLLKKERAEVRTNEVDITPEEGGQENARPRSSAANAHHMRQKSLPIHFHSDALMRCKREEREKKRRSFMGFWKIF